MLAQTPTIAATSSCRVFSAWTEMPASWQPWMRPLLNLQLLLLSKLQWDVRQSPDLVASKEFTARWPAKALQRAVKEMCSPCVGGHLLQQRAPALVPHVYSLGQMSQGRNGVELHGGAYVRGISAAQLTHFLGNMSCYLLAAAEGGQVDVLGEHPHEQAMTMQVLQLLPCNEVSAMYCLAWQLSMLCLALHQCFAHPDLCLH
jgi:hypothetical protein